jgi:predicted GNAT family acetyltransferase
MKKSLLAFCCCLLLAAVAVYAQTPAQNVSPAKHPNLAKAQSDLTLAFQKIVDAQKANEYDLGGHADKAKQLIQEASDHLKQAALAANQNQNDSSSMSGNRPQDAPPAATVNENKHGNLAKAQEYIQSAYTSIVDAQKANEYDLGGHAAKAKTVLEQAQKELKLAAEAASNKK